jgi:hypothetical protein
LAPELVSDVKRKLSTAKYWVIGEEIAPSTGTPHWQGFVWFHNVVRLATLKAILEGVPADLRVGDDKAYAMAKYCKKDGKFEEWGVSPAEGRKRMAESGAKGNAAHAAKYRKLDQLAAAGKFKEIREDYPSEWIRCHKTLRAIRMESFNTKETLDGELQHEWLYGDSGDGKSSMARRENPDYYSKDVDHDSERWWDMYEGEPVILIEDLSPYNIKMTDSLKKWSDRYAFKAQVKGAYMQIRPKKIVVTSQYTIDEIWQDEKTREALHRRFKEIKVDRFEQEMIRRRERERKEAEEKMEKEIDLDEEL